jgi:hypothetical protein
MIPALRCAALRPGGCISTSDLIQELTEEFEPDGEDAVILDDRNDSKFTQIVRNIKVHWERRTSMFSRGYAVRSEDGLCITEEGRTFLQSIPDYE